jgi:hypothetical protein
MPIATFSLHMPVASQKKPAWQGLASEQVRLQAPPLQLVGQDWVVPIMHAPLPSHMRAEDSVVPVHIPGMHWVPEGYLRHEPLPSHIPSRLQVAAPSSAHSLSGSIPAGTGTQRPSEPGSLQVAQVSVQAVSQQKPSTHDWVWHWLPLEQLAPRGRSGGGPASGVTESLPLMPPVSSVPTAPPVFLPLGFPPPQAAIRTDASTPRRSSLDRMRRTIHPRNIRYAYMVSARIVFKSSRSLNKIA